MSIWKQLVPDVGNACILPERGNLGASASRELKPVQFDTCSDRLRNATVLAFVVH